MIIKTYSVYLVGLYIYISYINLLLEDSVQQFCGFFECRLFEGFSRVA